jgi:hypothetical protein
VEEEESLWHLEKSKDLVGAVSNRDKIGLANPSIVAGSHSHQP